MSPITETLNPGLLSASIITNTLDHPCYLLHPSIHVAVCDSPTALAVDGLPKVAVMIVPEQRETDWIFSTRSGHLQLLFDHGLSRLILIGNDLPPNPHPCNYSFLPVPDTVDMTKLQKAVKRLALARYPDVCFQNRFPKPRFLTYEDDLLYRVIVYRSKGPVVGEFVVEDVLLKNNDDIGGDQKLRRRLRFKRIPNLVQSQVLLWPKIDGEFVTATLNLENLKEMKNAKFDIDTRLLVHPYLNHMVSGLFLIASHINQRIQQGFTPRALCLGVGGGSLLTFLNTELGFEVVGVDEDMIVLTVAKHFFGFNKGKSMKLVVGDAIDLIENFATKGEKDDSDSNVKIDGKFDVVMVDLYSNEIVNNGIICAPPPKFVRKSVIHGAKLLLDDHGVLIVNVASPNEEFYEKLVRELNDVFYKVFETEVDEEDNRVLMATVSPPISPNDYDFDFMEKLKSEIPGDDIEPIVRL